MTAIWTLSFPAVLASIDSLPTNNQVTVARNRFLMFELNPPRCARPRKYQPRPRQLGAPPRHTGRLLQRMPSPHQKSENQERAVQLQYSIAVAT